jgi:sigma-B regulation protein RsbU (phosphoserine phosphatase)
MTAAQKILVYQFPACAEQMGNVRLKLRDALGQCGQSEAVVNNVVLAIGEACMNIIQHAYGPSDKGDILLEVEWSHPLAGSKKPQSLVFRLTDFAKHKTSAEQMRSRPLDEIRPGGLGCHIINEVMDEVVLLDRNDGHGNVLELRKRL